MKSSINPRNVCLCALCDTTEKGKLSHRAAADIFNDERISKRDRAFILNLYYGVLERLVFLDYNIAAYSSVPLNKIKPVIRNILRQALYQMFFMDSVPERAAVSEALKLAQLRKMSSLKGFINGVLRTIQREGLKKDVPENVSLSVPLWMYEKVCEDAGKQAADEFFSACLKKNEFLYAGMNKNAADEEQIIKELEKDGCSVIKDGCMLKIKPEDTIESLGAFKKGFIYIQSPNSANAAACAQRLYGGGKNPLIVDVCASPGGKSINMAAAFPEGKVISRDRSEFKAGLIRENASRMKLSNISVQVWDACVFDEGLKEKADIVIADVPCSGLGVISGKPDIKCRLKEEDIGKLSALQRKILDVSSGYVKEGGVLIYSTCTLTKEENTQNALRFSDETGFLLKEETQYMMYKERADGFYVAGFIKN